MSSTVAMTPPTISIPASFGELTVISSNEAAAKLPPNSIPVSAPLIVPSLNNGVPDSLA